MFEQPPEGGSFCSCNPPSPCEVRLCGVGWGVDGRVGQVRMRGTVQDLYI